MRRLTRLVAAVATLLIAVAAAQGINVAGVELWHTAQPGAASFPTAPVLLGTDYFSVFWTTQQYSADQRSLTSFACAVGNPGQETPKCVAAPQGASFMSSPLPTGFASLGGVGAENAFAWSTQVNKTNGDSSLAYLSAGPQVATAVSSRSQSNIAYEAAVPFINPGEFLIRFTDLSPTKASTTIERVSIVDQALTFETFYTVWHDIDTRLSPSEATAIYVYEGFTYFLIQDQTQALLFKVNSTIQGQTNATLFQIKNPCNLSPSGDTMLHLRVAPYDTDANGAPLYALLLWGKLANGTAAMCRISHRSGVSEFNVSNSAVQIFPEIDKILTVSLGDGFAVITGRASSPALTNSALVYAIDARVGTYSWAHPLIRQAADQSNVPVISNAVVYLSVYGALTWTAVAFDGPKTVTSAVSCLLAAFVTPRRVYCVQSDRHHVVGISMLNPSETLLNWTSPAPVAFPVVTLPTDATVIVAALQDGTIYAISNSQPSAPSPSDDSHGGAIAAAILVPLCLVAGFGGAYYYFAKRGGVRRRVQRVAMEEDVGGGYSANTGGSKERNEGTSLYGST